MNFIRLSIDENIATVTLNRPKVNALNESLVEELYDCFQKLGGKSNANVKAVILTGEGGSFLSDSMFRSFWVIRRVLLQDFLLGLLS